MNFLELVNNRQSTRNFSDRPVSQEIINHCLEAARLAPSACNAQPWQFIVIDRPEFKNELARQIFSGIYAMNSFAARAPVLVVACQTGNFSLASLGGTLKKTDFALFDLGIACEHLVLQAQAEGLGSCYLGWFNEKVLRKLLNLPSQNKVELVIALGYPGDGTLRPKVRKPLSEIARQS